MKLSTYAKKGGKHHEENINQHYHSEEHQSVEAKVTK
jgi:hypothetical protein